MKDARVDSEGIIYQCVGDALRSIFPAVNDRYSWLLEEIRTARRDQAGSIYPTLKERLDHENLTLVKEKLSLSPPAHPVVKQPLYFVSNSRSRMS